MIDPVELAELERGIAAGIPELEALACGTCGERRPVTAAEAARYTLSTWPTCKQGHEMRKLVTKEEQ
jgi:hypothetical protein